MHNVNNLCSIIKVLIYNWTIIIILYNISDSKYFPKKYSLLDSSLSKIST